MTLRALLGVTTRAAGSRRTVCRGVKRAGRRTVEVSISGSHYPPVTFSDTKEIATHTRPAAARLHEVLNQLRSHCTA